MISLLSCAGGKDASPGHSDDSGDGQVPGDEDGDGYPPADGDCDDADPSVNPSAEDDPATAADENCDGTSSTSTGLLSATGESWNGERQGQLAGRSVAVGSHGAGFLVGATATSTQDGHGAAFLFGSDLAAPLATFRDTNGLFEEMGSAVVLPGDVDGDGRPDALVSADVAQTESGLAGGIIYDFRGANDGDTDRDDADVKVSGQAYTNLGTSLSSVSDWNEDGLPDVVAGATNVQQTYDQPGSAYVFGSPLTADIGLDQALAKFTGGGPWDYFGQTVQGDFDTNGDGIDDILIGAIKGDPDYSGRGYLFLGPLEGTIAAEAAEATVIGSSAVGETGYSLAGGDIDGDGLADIAFGAPLDDSVAERGGLAAVFLAPVAGEHYTDEADTRVEAEGDHRFLGAAMSLCGDLNGDGRADLVLGVPIDPSFGTTIPGGVFLWTDLPSGTTNTSSATLALFAPFAAAGRSLAAGDEDGDGFAEILVGAPYGDGPWPDAGGVYLVHAADLGL